ncbi:MAG: hypothetical protein KJ063_18075 [Anaerolineae bacterium]|nr:hypothetical protein [Anaerolineae bacterium]
MKRRTLILATVIAVTLLAVAAAIYAIPPWSENFDSYANGTSMHGVGGWAGWDNSPAYTGLVTNAQARSGPHSVAIAPTTDLVRTFTGYTSGVYDVIAWTYVPSTSTGDQYFILLNTYNHGGPYAWSTQLLFNQATNMIETNFMTFTGSAPLIEDAWVELRVRVNLDTNIQTLYYNGAQFATGSWSNGTNPPGVVNIAAIDLFSNGGSTIYYDDIAIVDASRSVAVNKTVSTDNSCGVSNNITAPYNSQVTYCYQITNTGNVTYDTHMVVDDQLGTVLPTTNYLLAPGASFAFTVTTMFTEETVTNVMTWTAWLTNTAIITSGSASATVTGQPTDVVLTSFGGGNVAPWLLPAAAMLLLLVVAGFMVLRHREEA